jgi:hypothetical protein
VSCNASPHPLPLVQTAHRSSSSRAGVGRAAVATVFSSPSTVRATIAWCFFNWSHPSSPSLSRGAAGAPQAATDHSGSSPPLERRRLSATELPHCRRPSPVSSIPCDRARRHPLTTQMLALLSPPHLVHRRGGAGRATVTAWAVLTDFAVGTRRAPEALDRGRPNTVYRFSVFCFLL